MHAHPSAAASGSPAPMIRLFGRRVMLRSLVPNDYPAWAEVRLRCEDWLVKWEPMRVPGAPDPVRDRDAFVMRCNARDRERMLGMGYGFGIFVDGLFAGEINVNAVQRGPFQNAYVGYWIDEARAGNAYMSEACVVLFKYAFEELHLHRLQISIIPRNRNSRRVMEKLSIREEGVALRYLEINGDWEDHVRYAITTEEWEERRDEFHRNWL
jgi:ribosomal-protein-alanine N-acetyltransferase